MRPEVPKASRLSKAPEVLEAPEVLKTPEALEAPGGVGGVGGKISTLFLEGAATVLTSGDFSSNLTAIPVGGCAAAIPAKLTHHVQIAIVNRIMLNLRSCLTGLNVGWVQLRRVHQQAWWDSTTMLRTVLAWTTISLRASRIGFGQLTLLGLGRVLGI